MSSTLSSKSGTKKRKPPVHPVTQYAQDVCDGAILAGRLVRLACQRHLRDLEECAARGLVFDEARANHALEFFPKFLRFAEGQFEGKPFELQPFQVFIVGTLFGWIGQDACRRFRKAYVEIGKGSGKSPLAAGIILYGLVADGEAGAEIYTAAVTRDQAGIIFRDVKLMAEASPKLRERLDIGEHNIAYKNSFIRAVSSEARSLDGKRVHMAAIDELHEHPTALVVEKMQAGTKGRLQPLIFEITNSGYDRESVCWKHREYSQKVLENVAEDDGWFAYVCQLDPCDSCRSEGYASPKDGCEHCDDWRDEGVWVKANPNLGISVTPRYLREQVREAIGMPSKESIVKRLNFCIWTQQDKPWIPIEAWDVCASSVDERALVGLTVAGGLDLSATDDMTALVLAFKHAEPHAPEPDDSGRLAINFSVTLLPFFWLPEATLEKRKKQEYGRLFARWEKDGLLTVTAGNSVDYDAVFDKIEELSAVYGLKSAEIGFDPWNGRHLSTQLLAAE